LIGEEAMVLFRKDLFRAFLKSGMVFILPSLIFLGLVTTYPLLQSFKLTVVDIDFFGKELYVGLKNFIRLIGDPLVLKVILNTLFFVFVGMGFHLAIGTGLALYLNRKDISIKVRSLCRSLLLIPWTVAPVITANMLRLFMHPDLSPLAGIFPKFMQNLNILGRANTALIAVTAANIWIATPFYMVLILAGLQGIPTDIYEAASMEKISKGQTFIYITLPALKPTIISLMVFDVIFNFGYFDLIWIMTSGGPLNSTEVLATYTYRLAFLQFNYSYGSLMALIMFMFTLCVSIIIIRTNKET
jgi:multiple sugar transport system permease protein